MTLKLNETLHIGIDDTDSPRMGCTTYVAALLVEKLTKLGCSFIDYPNIIRLNPNVPWKTRGNGALCLRVKAKNQQLDKVKETVIETIEENSDFEYSGTEPGVVFYSKENTSNLTNFARRTIQDVVTIDEALKLIETHHIEAVGFKNGRGVIGALAAVGEKLLGDHTYELIAYRISKNRGTTRKLNKDSIVKMDKQTKPFTFNNIDQETGRILITPRGPDPILYGIRGENPEIVEKASKMIKPLEEIERWVIFRTNHGTDAHLQLVQTISEIRPYKSIIICGTVSAPPQTIPGGHVIFTIENERKQIDCAAYAPTGNFRFAAKQLITGDKVEVYGGVRPATSQYNQTINLEKMRILKLVPKIIYQNPKCPKCNKTMKSMGINQGFRCEKCGFRSVKATKLSTELRRNLKEELFITPPRANRHLTKPYSRYGMEKSGLTIDFRQPWHYP